MLRVALLRVSAEVWLGAFDRGCRWKVSQEVLPGVSLMLFDPGCGRGMWRRVSLTVWYGGVVARLDFSITMSLERAYWDGSSLTSINSI